MSEPGGGRHQGRRWITAALAVLLLVALVGGTWWVARTTQSPAQKDAAAAPPSQAPVTATVVVGDLRDEVTAQGSVKPAQDVSVPLTLTGAGRSVITEVLVQPGQALTPGKAVLRVNGRPVIALPGAFPTYRDLVQGDTGDDVTQLQQALISLGYPLTADGDLGTATVNALKDLYQDLDTTVPTTRPTSSSSQGEEQAGTRQDTGQAGTQTGQGALAQTQQDQQAQQAQGTAQVLVTLPQSEVVYVPGLSTSATLAAAPAVGTVLTADNAQLTISSGTPHVEAEVPDTVATVLGPGTRATTTVDGTTVSLTVTSIQKKEVDATSQQAPGAMGSQTKTATYTLTAVPADGTVLSAPTPDTPSLLLTIERTPTVTGGLLVPKRALSTTGEHATVILVDGQKATTKEVTVLGCVGGQCAISADGPVKAGDQLRVDAT